MANATEQPYKNITELILKVFLIRCTKNFPRSTKSRTGVWSKVSFSLYLTKERILKNLFR